MFIIAKFAFVVNERTKKGKAEAFPFVSVFVEIVFP